MQRKKGTEIEKPVFIFAGFLESGKTTALQGTLLKTRTKDEGKALIICTEEGEEEYRIDDLESLGISVACVSEEEEFTAGLLRDLDARFSPESIYIEFNGMWDIKAFRSLSLPDGWFIANILSLVDASTYDLYLKNIRQTIMTPLSVSDVILFNRCGDSFKKSDVRRSLKVLNGRAEVYFTRKDGSIDDTFDELTIKDENGVINIDETLFCPWFVDTVENAEKYYGKTVSFTGMVTRGRELKDNQFYLGRYAMICCPEDAKFIGFVAESEGKVPADGDWVIAQARIDKGEISGNRQVILLCVEKFRKISAPEERFVFF
ncbi:MAG: hypothetical protein K5796_06950 [Lachnospiraceae bacterium]|nr:hypothetical protein [Lachnospiraceae bacterium]